MSELVADAHMHICVEDWRFGIDLVFTWDDLHNQFEERKIDRAIVMPMLSNTDDSLVVNKDFFDKLGKHKHRDKVWGYYWPHPHEVDLDLASSDDVSGVKFHPSISQTTIDTAPAVLKAARDNGIPLLVHSGRNQMSRIDYLLTARRMEPDITFIGAHLGGLANELILAALARIEALPSMDNLYLETSGCMNPKIMKRAIDVLGDDRILWGTDTPFFDHEISRLVLVRTGISEKSIRKILYENAVKLHK